jgi:AbrB family looped-hinge helix DNA binding protein
LHWLLGMHGLRPCQAERRLTVKLFPNRQVVIPKRLCEELDLRAGDLLEGTVEEGRVVFTPQAFVDRRVKTAIEDVGAKIPLWVTLRPALRRA